MRELFWPLEFRIYIYIWELIFIYCGLFVLILVGFFLCCFFFHYVSAKFHLWPSSGDFTATSDRNAESCNRIPSNYCVFWPSKPLAGLGRIWNRYFLTMLTWNRRDSTPLSAAPRAPKGDQGWIFWSCIILIWSSRVGSVPNFLNLSLIGIILRWGF